MQTLKAVRSVGPGGAFAPGRLLAHGPRGELVPCQAGGPGDLVLVPAPETLGAVGQAGFVLSDECRPFGPGRPIELREARTGRCTFPLQLGRLRREERTRLLEALDALVQEDDGLSLQADAHTGDYRLCCMGALHMELLQERLAEEFAVADLPLGRSRAAPDGNVAGAPAPEN